MAGEADSSGDRPGHRRLPIAGTLPQHAYYDGYASLSILKGDYYRESPSPLPAPRRP
jgi:hypothetical protein